MTGYTLEKMEQVFWSKVNKTATCWLWTGTSAGSKNMYGQSYGGKVKDLAHRMSYMIHKGAIPRDMLVRHKCNTPKCINPDHLEVGTQKDNIQDAIKSGRLCTGERRKKAFENANVARGERNAKAKLTAKQVLQIRSRYTEGLATQKQLGEEFGVRQASIYQIVNQLTWRHV